MKKRMKLSLLLAGALLLTLLCGCQQTADVPSASSNSASSVPTDPSLPPQPETVMGGYFTYLKVNFSDIFVTEVTATYSEDTITRVHTMDGTTYTEIFDFRGNLLLQRIEGPDDFLSEETFTYNDAGKQLSSVYVRDSYRRELSFTYDENNQRLTEEYSNSEGYSYQDTYTYDEHGRLVALLQTNSSGKNSTQEKIYDANGNCVSEKSFNKGTLERTVTRVYDENGLLTTEITETKNNTYTVTFTYDDAGNLLTENQTNEKGFWLSNIYTYTDSGLLLTDSYTDSDGNASSTIREYNDRQQLTAAEYRSGDSVTQYTYGYDDAGREISVRAVTGDFSSETQRVYDEAGNLLEESASDSSGYCVKDTYTYDAYGHVLTYTQTDADGAVRSACSYAYKYKELSPAEAEALAALMQNVFAGYLP